MQDERKKDNQETQASELTITCAILPAGNVVVVMLYRGAMIASAIIPSQSLPSFYPSSD